jgi:hypothetical protein
MSELGQTYHGPVGKKYSNYLVREGVGRGGYFIHPVILNEGRAVY